MCLVVLGRTCRNVVLLLQQVDESLHKIRDCGGVVAQPVGRRRRQCLRIEGNKEALLITYSKYSYSTSTPPPTPPVR